MKQYLVGLVVLLTSFGFGQNLYMDSLELDRASKAKELTSAESHVLTDEEIDHFKGLDFFPVNENYRLSARFEKELGKKFKMPTTTDRLPVYRRYGYAYFQIDSVEYRLTVYQNIELSKKTGYKDYLFIPFRDATCPDESYGGGRYIDLRIPDGNQILLDFNTAYNPYCAYSYRYSCPVPPEENTLLIPIRAGEKKPIGH